MSGPVRYLSARARERVARSETATGTRRLPACRGQMSLFPPFYKGELLSDWLLAANVLDLAVFSAHTLTPCLQAVAVGGAQHTIERANQRFRGERLAEVAIAAGLKPLIDVLSAFIAAEE